jgi:hypothetical protein
MELFMKNRLENDVKKKKGTSQLAAACLETLKARNLVISWPHPPQPWQARHPEAGRFY